MIESAKYGQNGPLGSDIVGAGVANPYYEIGMPVDGVHDTKPIGVMIEIHGGGYVGVGAAYVGRLRPDADFWRIHGWETVSIDYRRCAQSLGDVLAFYARVRQLAGPKMPICASGQSVGGSLALILAAEAGPGGLSCVIGEAAVTDIGALAAGRAYPSGFRGVSAPGLYDAITAAFATSDPTVLSQFSPISYAAAFTTPALLGRADNDILVPVSQATSFRQAVQQAHPGDVVDIELLPCPALGPLPLLGCPDTPEQLVQTPGDVVFVHGTTSRAGLTHFRSQELAFADAAVGAPLP